MRHKAYDLWCIAPHTLKLERARLAGLIYMCLCQRQTKVRAPRQRLNKFHRCNTVERNVISDVNTDLRKIVVQLLKESHLAVEPRMEIMKYFHKYSKWACLHLGR